MKGWLLTNQTVGGEGVVFLTDDQAERAKAARRAGFTPNVRAQMSNSIRAAWADPEKRERIISAQREAHQRPEVKAERLSRGDNKTPEGRERQRAAIIAYMAQPEVKQRKSELMKARMSDPEYVRELARRSRTARQLKQKS